MDTPRRDDRCGRPLRLLWLIDSLAMGGAERLAVVFAREATAAGIDLRVCCLKRIDGNPIESEMRKTGVPCEILDAGHLRDRRAFARLRQVMHAGGFHLVHAHLMSATIWGVPAARLARVPLVTTLHVPPSTDPPWHRQRVRERVMCGLLNQSGATVIAVSAALRDRYVRRRLFDPSRVIVVHNGIDSERYSTVNAEAAGRLRREFALPQGARVMISTAVLREPRKGLHVLLDALPHVLAACPDARLIVIGDGRLKSELQAQARRLGIADSVRWAGARTDVDALLAGADLFIHPALDDPFPTVVLEAMAAALPVVATSVDGIPEMIAHGLNGRLVPPCDSLAMAMVVSELLARPHARAALGEAARQTVLERFSTPIWMRRLDGVYRQALDDATPVAPLRAAPPMVKL